MSNDLIEIQNDCFSFLELDNIFFKFNDGTTALIKPFWLEINEWDIFSSRELSQENGYIVFIKNEKEIEIPVKTILQENEYVGKYYKIFFLDNLPIEIEIKIKEYKKIILSSHKRREERFVVGVANTTNFKLSKPDVLMLVGNQQSRCIFNDVSVHGASLLGQRAMFKINDTRITLIARFSNPNEQVKINGVIVNANKQNNSLYRYSIKFIKPISILWQKRIFEYSNLLETFENKNIQSKIELNKNETSLNKVSCDYSFSY